MADNRIITEGLEYLVYRFQGQNEVWRLVGTESFATLPETLDTFRSSKGHFISTKRENIYKQQEEGKIRRVDEDIIPEKVLHIKKEDETQNKLF